MPSGYSIPFGSRSIMWTFSGVSSVFAKGVKLFTTSTWDGPSSTSASDWVVEQGYEWSVSPLSQIIRRNTFSYTGRALGFISLSMDVPLTYLIPPLETKSSLLSFITSTKLSNFKTFHSVDQTLGLINIQPPTISPVDWFKHVRCFICRHE